jgi:hypothetical protein
VGVLGRGKGLYLSIEKRNLAIFVLELASIENSRIARWRLKHCQGRAADG